MIFVDDDDLFEEVGVADIIFLAGHSYCQGNNYIMDSNALKRADSLNGKSLAGTFGSMIFKRKRHRAIYGITHTGEIVSGIKGTQYGLFQNRKKVEDIAQGEIVKQSVKLLKFWATEGKWERIALEMPNDAKIGEAEMMPFLLELPDNVFVYRRPLPSLGFVIKTT